MKHARITTLSIALFVAPCLAVAVQDKTSSPMHGPGARNYATAAEAVDALASPAGEAYLIYLHGAIIERGDRRPSHLQRGVYEYDQILDSLASTGRVVISEQRSRGTEVVVYAERVAAEVRALIDTGVDPRRITVVGFSKGAAITLHAADRLGRDDVGFVILAICGPWLESLELTLRGNFLSIHEASDQIGGSCADAVARSPEAPASFEEIEIHTGDGHGAFWRPRAEWVDPVLAWIGRSAP